MGNFQACTTVQNEKDDQRGAPPGMLAYDGMRPSEEPRDSSIGRAIVEPAIVNLRGADNLPMIKLVHRSGSTCELYLLGATVTSYRPISTGCSELLYTPKDIEKDIVSRKGICGGIPVIFPNFGCGEAAGLSGIDLAEASAIMPAHGFARLLTWTVELYVLSDLIATVAHKACSIMTGQRTTHGSAA